DECLNSRRRVSPQVLDKVPGDVGRNRIENMNPGADQGIELRERVRRRRQIDKLRILVTRPDLGHRGAPWRRDRRQPLRFAARQSLRERAPDIVSQFGYAYAMRAEMGLKREFDALRRSMIRNLGFGARNVVLPAKTACDSQIIMRIAPIGKRRRTPRLAVRRGNHHRSDSPLMVRSAAYTNCRRRTRLAKLIR